MVMSLSSHRKVMNLERFITLLTGGVAKILLLTGTMVGFCYLTEFLRRLRRPRPPSESRTPTASRSRPGAVRARSSPGERTVEGALDAAFGAIAEDRESGIIPDVPEDQRDGEIGADRKTSQRRGERKFTHSGPRELG